MPVNSDYYCSKRILREGKVWSKMRHKNILPLIGFWKGFSQDSDSQKLSFITPWMDDGDLLSNVTKNKDLSCLRRLNYVRSQHLNCFVLLKIACQLRDIASGLAYSKCR